MGRNFRKVAAGTRTVLFGLLVVGVFAIASCSHAPVVTGGRKGEGPAAVTSTGGAVSKIPPGFSFHAFGEAAEAGASVEAFRLRIVDPEGESWVELVELDGLECDAAIARAWTLAEPTFDGQVLSKKTPPGVDGFDEKCVVIYAPSLGGQISQAVGRRLGERTWVHLIHGSPTALGRRGAQLQEFLAGMEVPGLVEVSLAARPLISLKKSTAQLKEFVSEAMRLTGTPGLSIAVVEDDEVVFVEGFGLRDKDGPEPVTADTLMMIGSVSKSMTTLMAARAVDRGVLAWDTPAASLLGGLMVGNKALTDRLTVETLFCACSGVPRKDLPLVFHFQGKRPADAFEEVRTMEPTTGFRETFQYQNHLVGVGGFLAARRITGEADWGKAYDRAMRDEVFTPLGMGRSTTEFDRALKEPDRAAPHAQDLKGAHHKLSVELERFVTFLRPSGGVWSSAREMAQYIRLELGRGEFDGKRVIGADPLTRRWKPQVSAGADRSYGLGWAIAESRGLRWLSHGGGTMGFGSLLAMLPDRGVGVVMLSNGTGGHLAENAIRERLLELWFDVDLNAAGSLTAMLRDAETERTSLAGRISEPPGKWVAPFLGTKSNSDLGPWKLDVTAEGYEAQLSAHRSRVVRYDRPDGKTVLLLIDPPLAGIELSPVVDEPGALEVISAQERYVYR